MSYADHFKLVDDILPHIEETVNALSDAFLQSRYVGFFSVSAAAVFELAIKQILIDFARSKHDAFGDYCAASLRRLNGKIQLDTLNKEYVKLFRSAYLDNFREKLLEAENRELINRRYSVKTAYGQIITWRHAFSHEGLIPVHATFAEAKQGYESGKIVVSCLASAMI